MENLKIRSATSAELYQLTNSVKLVNGHDNLAYVFQVQDGILTIKSVDG